MKHVVLKATKIKNFVGMMLAKVKEQNGIMLAKVKIPSILHHQLAMMTCNKWTTSSKHSYL